MNAKKTVIVSQRKPNAFIIIENKNDFQFSSI